MISQFITVAVIEISQPKDFSSDPVNIYTQEQCQPYESHLSPWNMKSMGLLM